MRLAIDLPGLPPELANTNYLLWTPLAFQNAPGVVARGTRPFNSVRMDPNASSPHAVVAVDLYGNSTPSQILTPGTVARFDRQITEVRVWNPFGRGESRPEWYGSVTLEAGFDLEPIVPPPMYQGSLCRAALIQSMDVALPSADEIIVPPSGCARGVRFILQALDAAFLWINPVDLDIRFRPSPGATLGPLGAALANANRAYWFNTQLTAGLPAGTSPVGINVSGAAQTANSGGMVHEDNTLLFDANHQVIERPIVAPGAWYRTRIYPTVTAGTNLAGYFLAVEYF